jgi:hypothetical protein
MQKQQVLKLQHLLQVNNEAKEEETGKWSFWKAETRGKVW